MARRSAGGAGRRGAGRQEVAYSAVGGHGQFVRRGERYETTRLLRVVVAPLHHDHDVNQLTAPPLRSLSARPPSALLPPPAAHAHPHARADWS